MGHRAAAEVGSKKGWGNTLASFLLLSTDLLLVPPTSQLQKASEPNQIITLTS